MLYSFEIKLSNVKTMESIIYDVNVDAGDYCTAWKGATNRACEILSSKNYDWIIDTIQFVEAI